MVPADFFFYLLELCITKAWLLYQMQNKANQHFVLHKFKKKILKLKDFRKEIIQSLFYCGKKVRGRRSGIFSNKTTKISKTRKLVPTEDIRFDSFHHFPLFSECRQRCTLCILNKPLSFSEKCNVYLCCNKSNSCFYDYYKKTE